MIRLILVLFAVVAFLILSIPILIVEWLIGKKNPKLRDESSLHIVQFMFRLIQWLAGTKVTVIGEENVPDEPVLFIGNHRSYFDIVITYARCKNLTGYIAKKEMLSIPLLRTWMKRLYCLFLDRENPKEGLKTILQAIDYVKHGVSICIFPEGTRNNGEELSLLPFHNGSFKIAVKTGCPIVPMSLNNTCDIFEGHIPFIKKTHVILEYGKPIYPKELDKDEKKRIGEHCSNIIRETIHKNQALV